MKFMHTKKVVPIPTLNLRIHTKDLDLYLLFYVKPKPGSSKTTHYIRYYFMAFNEKIIVIIPDSAQCCLLCDSLCSIKTVPTINKVYKLAENLVE
jgi:hypothetical protein